LIVPPLGATIKLLNALSMLRSADGKFAQPGMGAPTRPGMPLGRAPDAPFKSPEVPIDDLCLAPLVWVTDLGFL